MSSFQRILTAGLAAITLAAGSAAVSPAQAAPTSPGKPHVVSGADIQGRIDRQLNQDQARQATILTLLQRPEVQRVAGSAGLDLTAARAGVPLLSAAELQEMSARAAEIDAQLGGDSVVIISTTALIIILLLILILAK